MIRLINLRVAVTVKTGLQELLEKKFPPLRVKFKISTWFVVPLMHGKNQM